MSCECIHHSTCAANCGCDCFGCFELRTNRKTLGWLCARGNLHRWWWSALICRYGGGPYGYAKKKRRKNHVRLGHFGGVALAVASFFPIWLGMSLLYAHSVVFSLALIARGSIGVWYGVLCAIAEQETDTANPHENHEPNEQFNGESFPSHLGGKGNE